MVKFDINTVPVLLDRFGEILWMPIPLGKLLSRREDIFPIVVEPYIWDNENQLKSASDHKDQIMRVHYPEMTRPEQVAMLDDDRRRIELVGSFVYGPEVLEIGSSDGTVSLKIAERPEVKNILAIDIRPDAVEDGRRLVDDLLRKGKVKKATTDKFSIKCSTIIDHAEKTAHETYDAVCAYEVFEHIAPHDFVLNFTAAYSLLKPNGKFFMSVPNRYPDPKYEKSGRARWRWIDHKNYFTAKSLRFFLSNFFDDVIFYPLYEGEEVSDSIYLIAECHGKKYGN